MTEANQETISSTPPRRRPRWPLILGGAALLGLLAASWFALPIRKIEVTGQSHLSATDVRRLAGAEPGFGWLYYGAWRAQGLLQSPWVQRATVVRRFPDALRIEVTERRPVARYQPSGGAAQALATDGTVMPGAGGLDALPLIRGWGPDRTGDALKVLAALAPYNVQAVAYTPSGLTATLPAGTVWSGDLGAMLKYAGSIGMYPNTNISIYPWGVSVRE